MCPNLILLQVHYFLKTPKTNVSEILGTDARHTSYEIVKMVGISEGSMRTILKKKRGMSRITAR
jgi:hypothetical protein